MTDVKAVIAITALSLLTACSHVAQKPVSLPPAVAKGQTSTGIPGCDAYLNNYLACHEAAGIYDRGLLQTHYQTMRETLLQEASDPSVRPYLADRCAGLTRQLNDALQGRSCTPQNTVKPVTQH
ncbi:hypothetical protein [Dyella sp. 2HG41-7]|uniref:hypothetical protein n=1 Tax=Dyella sp. 2HG41-7 TaxID=2883239 RepID=UPI001F47B566|nr:hypothetical protein [Dyella sp. 2HG41-7]